VLLLLLVAVLVSGSAARAAPGERPCRASLPRGPAVPAPIVFRTSCGAFRLAPDGRIARLPPGSFADRGGGTGRRYGADLRIQRNRPGRIVLLRRGRVAWRSSGLYRNDAGSIAFGPDAFAFAAYKRGIFLTDLNSPERLVLPGPALHPVAFLRGGELLVADGAHHSLSVLAPDGSLLRRHRYRARNGYVFDQLTETVFFVTPERMLVRADATGVHVVRRLWDLDGWIWLAGPYLTLSDEGKFAVVRRDGTLVSRWSLPPAGKSRSDLSPVASDDGRMIAFRRVPARRPRGGTVVVYVLRQGEKRPTEVYRHTGGQVGCGVNASFGWHGRFLLYSSTDGGAVVVDNRGGRARSLAELASQLPHRLRGERAIAYWASDFAKP
jgi:hypothetical protein